MEKRPHVNIIAEIGINHNGNIELAKLLADAAKSCGCDFIKLQKRTIDWCYSPEQLAKPCDSPWGKTIGDKVRGRELSWNDIEVLDAHCRDIGIPWITSCFDLKSLWELHEKYPDRPMNKVPSALAMRKRYMEEVASQGIRTLISTGLLSDSQILEVCELFDSKKCEYVINHVVALYPCPQHRLNLHVIPVLAHILHKRSHCMGIGYSGHETGILPSVIAVQLGATYIERHITLDRSMYGSDQAASLEVQGLERLVRDVRALNTILGSGDRALKGDEKNPVTFWREP